MTQLLSNQTQTILICILGVSAAHPQKAKENQLSPRDEVAGHCKLATGYPTRAAEPPLQTLDIKSLYLHR